jgi:hypothetical protein
MANSNEKLIAGLVALLPVAREALKDSHFDRQLDAFASNDKIRLAGSDMINKAKKYIRRGVGNNKFARQIAAQWAPQPSPLPAIALAVVGAGLIWAYMARRKTARGKANSIAKAETHHDHHANRTVDGTASPNH